MKQTKRKRNNNDCESNRNKRKKITVNNIYKSSLTYFEDLSNEVIYEIFDFLDMYHIYEAFGDLNKRFNKLINNSTIPIKINIFSMSKSNFQNYKSDFILPNKHRIISLELSNALIFNDILSPADIISKFIRLQTLILENINLQQLENVLNHAISLPNLYSLSIYAINTFKHPNNLYLQICRLPKLKYCKIRFELGYCLEVLPMATDQLSSIEHLEIDNSVYYDTFDYLLSYVPQLRYLSIGCLNGAFSKRTELSPIVLKHLTYVSIEFHYIYFNQFEKLIKDSFSQIQVLHISMAHDITYLDANRWEQIILSYMPNLNEFHMKHAYSIYSDDHYVNQFTSSFWIERPCFYFDEQRWRGSIRIEVFYSSDSSKYKGFLDKIKLYYFYIYRKKHKISFKIKYGNNPPYEQKINFNTINNLYVHDLKALDKCVHYFPNLTNLTFSDYLDGYIFNSFETTLNRILPLVQITKLFIKTDSLRFERLIKTLCFTPNIQTLKYTCTLINDEECMKVQQSESFELVSNTNTIKNVILGHIRSLEMLTLIVALFPRLEHLETGMNRKELNTMLQFLLSNTNYLFFLRITNLPKVCLREVKRLIKLEKLLSNYYIEFSNRSLYLWWK